MGTYQQGQPILITDTFTLSGVATDPTTVTYTILAPDGTTDVYTWPGDPEIAHPGVGQFELSLSPPLLPGLYSYDVDSTGTVVASRSGSFTVLANVSTPSDATWAVAGPCTPWCSSQDVWNCCGQPTTVVNGVECNVDFSREAMAASQILYELSGRRFSGGCEITVRPCVSDSWCGVQVLSRGHLIGWDGSHWDHQPGGRACGCGPLDAILLSGYPVREIVEVKIDGAVVDPGTYRLDERRDLVRVRDVNDPTTSLRWPACQTLDLPDTEAGTFSVTYRYGQDPPLAGVMAASELACELYKACNGGECALPSSVTRVSRQGVVVERHALFAWGLNDGIWRTGLSRVDAFLNAYNQPRVTRRPAAWSPDGRRYARPQGQQFGVGT